MSTPEDESKPQQPAEGGVPPVPPAAPVSPTPPVPPADTAPPAASPTPPVAPTPPAQTSFPAYGATPAYGAVPAAPVAAPTTIPTVVTVSFWLYVLSAVLSVANGIVTLSSMGAARQAALDQVQSRGTVDDQTAQTIVDSIIAFAVTWSIVTLIFWAIAFVLFAFFMRRGANWARIVLTVLTALSLFNVLIVWFGPLQVLASIAALVLIWLRPATEWFAAVKASKVPRA